MNIDRELVLHIAKLAHLDLSEDEITLFAGQLQNILNYIEQLNEVEGSGEPFSFSHFLPHVQRPDAVQPSLDVEEALRNAPERVKRLFKVPRIIP